METKNHTGTDGSGSLFLTGAVLFANLDFGSLGECLSSRAGDTQLEATRFNELPHHT